MFEYFVPLGNTGYCDGLSPNDSKKNRLDIRRFPQWKIKDNSKRKTKFSDRITEKKIKAIEYTRLKTVGFSPVATGTRRPRVK